MKYAFTYLEAAGPRAATATIERCFRAVQIVAGLWTLAACVIMMYILNSATPSPKARTFGIGCVLISAALYSVLIPIWYILKRSTLADDL